MALDQCRKDDVMIPNKSALDTDNLVLAFNQPPNSYLSFTVILGSIS